MTFHAPKTTSLSINGGKCVFDRPDRSTYIELQSRRESNRLRQNSNSRGALGWPERIEKKKPRKSTLIFTVGRDHRRGKLMVVLG